MSHHPTDFQGDILSAMRDAIAEALPGAQIQVQGGGGHFEVAVVSEAFEGKRTLARHRLVMAALAPLMAGDSAPVHAIDRLVTNTP
jgi:acid stress-induced BolA-like protein IbaG/YrbA